MSSAALSGEQPGVAVRVLADLHRNAAPVGVGVEQFAHVLLDAGEGAALDAREADRTEAGGGEPGAGLEGEGGGGHGEELVEVGADRFAAAQDGVEKTHERSLRAGEVGGDARQLVQALFEGRVGGEQLTRLSLEENAGTK